MLSEKITHPHLLNLTTIFCLTASLLTCLLAPLSHNPDGNYYYGVALLVSRGEFLHSIDGMYGPLLSWGMAPLIALGLEVQAAFRVVNFFGVVGLLLVMRSICQALDLSEKVTSLVLGLVGLHFCYFTVCLISSDLLGAPFFLAGCYWLICYQKESRSRDLVYAGLMGGLAYYCKAILLVSFILAVGVLFTLEWLFKKSTLRKCAFKASLPIVTCLLLASPWIVALSIKYKTPIFTGQQLIATHPFGRYAYSPENYTAVIGPDRSEQVAPANSSANTSSTVESGMHDYLQGRYQAMQFALPFLFQVTSDLLFSTYAAIFFLLVVGLTFSVKALRLRKDFSLSVVLIFFAVHTLIHAVIWGPYIRYYFAIFPLAHLLFVLGIFEFYKILQTKSCSWLVAISTPRIARAWVVFCAGMILCMVIQTSKSVSTDWLSKSSEHQMELIKYAANLPILSRSSGVITGNFKENYPPLIAYYLKRPYWNTIDPNRNESTEVLAERLRKWRVSNVIWFGDIYQNLDRMPGAVRDGPFEVEGKRFFVYSLQD